MDSILRRLSQAAANSPDRADEVMLHSILDSLFAFVGVLRLDGTLVEANRAPLEAAGLKKEDVIGQLFWECWWWSYSPEIQQQLRDAVELAKGGTSSRYDVEVRMKDGELVPIDFMLTPARNNEGEITHLVPSAVPIRERKQAEAALRSQLALTRAITDNATMALLIMDDRQQCVFMNPAAERLTGYTLAEVAGRPLHDVIHHTRPDGSHYPLSECPVDRAFPECNQTQGEEVFVHRDGSFYHVFFTASPMRNETGVVGTVIEVIDITERKKQEAEKREREALLDAILDALPVAIAISRRDGHLIRMNPAFDRVWGQSAPRTAKDGGYPGYIGYHADTGLPVTPTEWPLAQALSTGNPIPGRIFEIDHFDNQKRLIVEISAAPVLGDEGQVIGGVAATSDVTERVLAERAARAAEEEFRTLANAIPQLCWMAHPQGDIFWYNDRWFEYTGTTPEQMQGWGWRSVHDPDVLPTVMERWQACLDAGEPLDMTFPLRGRDGKFRPFLTRVMPVKNSAGKVVRWFGTNTDVSEQKRTEGELRRANADLQQFAYSSAHDLQEPARTLALYTELFRRKAERVLDEETRAYMDFISNGSRRMLNLVSDLLAYTTATAKVKELVPVESETVLRNVIEMLTSASESVNATITYEPLPKVRVSPSQLGQVFQNLLTNALKYRHPTIEPVIHISTSPQGSLCRFSVRDNGMGIPREYHEQIFGLFRRLHNNYGEYPGTGLGLALCRKLVETWGGQIWVESSEGEGATFHFTAPLP